MSETVQIREYSPKKKTMIDRVINLAKRYPVIALADLTNVRAIQLMAIRKILRGSAEILVVKNKLAAIALGRAGLSNIDEIVKNLQGQKALIFSILDPFKLQLTLEKNKVYLQARAGDIAPEDILIPAGNTGLPAGPILGEFREAGIPTRIEAGSIWIIKDSIAAKKGTVISPKLASLLSKLGIKPIKAGLTVVLAYERGTIYGREMLTIDIEKYKENLVACFINAFGLAVQIGYLSKETALTIIKKVYQEALVLSIEAGFITPETAPYILLRAESEAIALLKATNRDSRQTSSK